MNFVLGIIAVLLLGGGAYWYVEQNAAPTLETTVETKSVVDDHHADGHTHDDAGMDEQTMELDASEPAVVSEIVPAPAAVPAVSEPVVAEPVVVESEPEPAAVTRTFDISGRNFAFDVTELRVKEGDTVTVNFTSASGFHDWVVDEFAAATDQISAGKTTSVTFVADQKGSFEYYCSVGSHRANGMVGTLIVE